MPDISPKDAQTQTITVGGLVGVRRLKAEEIRFHIAGKFCGLSKWGINLKRQSRILRRETRFGQTPLWQLVVERNRSERSGNTAANIGAAVKRGEIQKTAWSEFRSRNFERQ